MGVSKSQLVSLNSSCLKTLGCSPQFLDTCYNVTRLRLNFENSSLDNKGEIDVLGRVLHKNLNKNMNSFAIFLNHACYRFQPYIYSASRDSPIFPCSGRSINLNAKQPNEKYLRMSIGQLEERSAPFLQFLRTEYQNTDFSSSSRSAPNLKGW